MQAGAPVFELFLDKVGIVFLPEMHATVDIHHFEILDVPAATFDVVRANNSAGRSVSNVLKAHFVPRTACLYASGFCARSERRALWLRLQRQGSRLNVDSGPGTNHINFGNRCVWNSSM